MNLLERETRFLLAVAVVLIGCVGAGLHATGSDGAATGGGNSGAEDGDIGGAAAAGGSAEGGSGVASGGAGGTETGGVGRYSSGGSSSGGTGVATGGATSQGGSAGVGQDGGVADGEILASPDTHDCDLPYLLQVTAQYDGSLGYCYPASDGPYALVFDSDGRVVDNMYPTGEQNVQSFLQEVSNETWPCLAGQTLRYTCLIGD